VEVVDPSILKTKERTRFRGSALRSPDTATAVDAERRLLHQDALALTVDSNAFFYTPAGTAEAVSGYLA
jgi:hypothetical protein